MIVNDENRLHSTIKKVSRLMSSLNSKHLNVLHYSMDYLNGFQTEKERDEDYSYSEHDNSFKV